MKIFQIRHAVPEDAEAVAELLAAYMNETYHHKSIVTAEVIRRDGFGMAFRLVVAQASNNILLGFAAWEASYDLHHGIRGGNVMDMYVLPHYRGRGIAPAMLATVAHEIQSDGGIYLKGMAIEGGVEPRRLYERVAMGFPGIDCIIGGRAFREFAKLAGADVRPIVRHLPPKSWNYEP